MRYMCIDFVGIHKSQQKPSLTVDYVTHISIYRGFFSKGLFKRFFQKVFSKGFFKRSFQKVFSKGISKRCFQNQFVIMYKFRNHSLQCVCDIHVQMRKFRNHPLQCKMWHTTLVSCRDAIASKNLLSTVKLNLLVYRFLIIFDFRNILVAIEEKNPYPPCLSFKMSFFKPSLS